MEQRAISRTGKVISSSLLMLLSLTIGASFLSTCVKTPAQPVPTTGSITGRVTDHTTAQPIEGAQITTVPTTISVLSSSDGSYTISNIEAQQYTVSASKSGFNSNSVLVSVVAGQTATGDITLSAVASQLAITPNPLDFSTTQTQLALTLTNSSGVGTITWSATTNRSWIHLSTTQGAVASQAGQITVTVSRDSLTPGNYSGTIAFTSNGGNPTVQVLMVVPNSTAPQLSVSVQTMDFDSVTTQRQFTLSNTGNSALDWQIAPNQTWLSASPASGSTAAGTNRTIIVLVSRDGLSIGQYSGTLTITSNGGNIQIPVQMKVTPVRPLAPSNLRAQLSGDRAIALSWNDNSNNEEGFRLERRVSTQSAFNTLATLSANATTYTDTGLTAHVRYIYRVYAYNQYMNSTYSNLDSATIGNHAPDAPFNPSPADNASNQSAGGTMSWTATDPDLDTLRFDVYLGTNNPPTLFTSNVNNASLAYSGLRANMDYYWKVAAKDNYAGVTNGPVWHFTTEPPRGTTFSQVISVSQTQEGRYVSTTVDHGYICTGYTGIPTYQYDLWVSKINESGIAAWTRSYGGAVFDRGNVVKQTWDGGYIVVGSTSSYGHGGSDVWLLKLNANGDTVWTRTFGGNREDSGWDVIQTRTSDYVIAGMSYSYGNDAQMYLLKVNTSGTEVWHRTYGGANYDGAYSITETLEGGYAVAGMKSDASGNVSWWMQKVDTSGAYVWDRLYGSANSGFCYTVKQLFGGDYVLTGEGVTTTGLHKLWLIRTDAMGNQRWLRQFGGNAADFGNGLCPTSDGGLIITGSTESYGAGGADLWLIKTNSNGDSLWTRTFGTVNTDRGVTVQQTYENGFIIIGNTAISSSSNNIWLLKTDPNGNVAGMR